VQLQQPANEFWGSTPKRVNRLFAAYARTEKTRDARVGVVASLIANANRGKHQRPYRPEDFFPSLRQRVRDPVVMGQEFLAVAKAARRKAGLG
jgi:hypothetical protein